MSADPEIIAALDESRALTLALLERLTEKLAPGSYLTVLSKQDAEAIMQRKVVIVERFRADRRAAASALILPPGATR